MVKHPEPTSSKTNQFIVHWSKIQHNERCPVNNMFSYLVGMENPDYATKVAKEQKLGRELGMAHFQSSVTIAE